MLNRDDRQVEFGNWVEAVFGRNCALDVKERATRVLEEACELAQASNVGLDKVLDLVQHVYEKPAGKVGQEAGGLGVCLLAFCEAIGVSADELEQREFDRVTAHPLEHFRVRQNTKADAGVVLRVPA